MIVGDMVGNEMGNAVAGGRGTLAGGTKDGNEIGGDVAGRNMNGDCCMVG